MSTGQMVGIPNAAALISGAAAQASAASASASAASASASAAAASEGAAQVSEADALAASLAAADAQAAAESARDVAQTISGIYASTTAGLAATASGSYFYVPAGTSQPDVLILYLDNAGTAVEQGRVPSSVAVLTLKKALLPETTDTAQDLYVWLDGDDNVVARLDADGGFRLVGMDTTVQAATTITVNRDDTAGDVEVLLDFNDQVIRRTDGRGGQRLPGLIGTVQAGIRGFGLGTYDAEILHVITYGQSLSEGYNAIPPITTYQRHNSLRFVGGVRPTDGGTAPAIYASLVPLIETQNGVTQGETPTAGTLEGVQDLILQDNGLAYGDHSFQLLGSAAGENALTIAQLSKGSAYYTELLAHVTAGLAAATALDKTYAVGAVTWSQGEADYLNGTPAATYIAALDTLVSDLNVDIKAITGQTRDVHLVCYQLASHKFYGRTDPIIAKAMVEATDNPLIHVAAPTYFLPHATDNIHLTADSSKKLGAYYGLAIKRILVDGATWAPLKPVSAVRQGKAAVLTFEPVGSLVLDTTTVTANTNSGFELVDSGGGALTISSVALLGDNRVKITAASSIPAGAKVRYAWTGAGTAGPVNGPRGNLRDSQGDVAMWDPSDRGVPLHNWCVIFEQAL